MNILITGGAGGTAQPIIDLLRGAGHSIAIFDISTGGDVRNPDNVRDAMRGVDAVIHLAVNIADMGGDKLTFETNVFGAYNVLRGALDNNVRKVLLASSAPVHTTGEFCSPGEDFAYDLTKCLQEEIARHFALIYGMNIMALRLGHIVDGRRKTDLRGVPLAQVEYCKGGWVCRYDVARAFAQAIDTGFTGYNTINAIGSYQAAGRFDLSGFECRKRFPEY